MIDCLKTLLPITDRIDTANNTIELKEESQNTTIKIELTGLPTNAFATPIPAQGKGHISFITGCKKSCDYLILSSSNNCIDAYFVEIKETLRPDTFKRACKQILCTTPIWDYIVSMVKVCFQKEQKINRYFVVIAKKERKKFSKQKTKPKQKITAERHSGEKFTIVHSSLKIPIASLRQ